MISLVNFGEDGIVNKMVLINYDFVVVNLIIEVVIDDYNIDIFFMGSFYDIDFIDVEFVEFYNWLKKFGNVIIIVVDFDMLNEKVYVKWGYIVICNGYVDGLNI